MNMTPTKIDFMPSSTPINPHDDSGYIGSERKSVAKKLFHTLTPIKEDPLRAKKVCPDSDSGIYSPTPSMKHIVSSLNKLHKIRNDIEAHYSLPGVVRELNFNESSDLFNESFNNEEKKAEKEKVVTRYPLIQWEYSELKLENSPRTLSKISDRKSAIKKKVDYFNELKARNCEHVVMQIHNYLSDEDINSVYSVSKTCKEMVKEDKVANLRRKIFLKNQKMQQENLLESRLSGINDRYDRSTVLQKYVFDEITNITPVPKKTVPTEKSIKQCNAKFESFIREGKNLQSGILMKCPKCSFAAKNQNGDEYICTECEYVFCKHCLCPILKFHDCRNVQIPMTVIGSKKSRRNLRRL